MDPNDNNLIALGLDDATIAVYNVRQDSVEWASKKTHKAAVTGAARVLISTASDRSCECPRDAGASS